MRAGLLDDAVTLSGWLLSLAGPALMPDRLTSCGPASSLIDAALSAFKVGASLAGLIVTARLRDTLLLLPWPSLSVTVIVTGPLVTVLAFAAGVKVSVPVVFGLV